jgi:hypothetical protein
MQSSFINVQENPIHSTPQLSLRKERHMFQPEPNTSLRNDDIGNDQFNTPFSFIPPLPGYSFHPFWQPLHRIGNCRLVMSRLVRLEEEIEQLKQIIGSLDSLLRCVNIKSFENCAGLPPTTVSSAVYAPIPSGGSGGIFPFIPNHSGVVVSSTYNRPAGTDGHGTVTLQHFGNKPKV